MAPSDDRDESHDEKLDRNWDDLLQELRVAQTGLQLLSGFLLTLPFTQVFAQLDHGQKGLYLGLVVLAGVAVGLNLTPVMLHRRLFGEHVKERVVEVGHVVSQVVIAAIALLIVGTAALIFSVVTGWTAGLVAAAGLAVVLGTLLGVVPRVLDPR
jgi:ABC-type multidrug transport system fused ATPase/permease subunit